MPLFLKTGIPAKAKDDIELPSFPKSVKGVAMGISILLHPLFVPLIGTWLIVTTHYYQFAGFHGKQFLQLYGSVISNTVLLPGFTVLMLWKLKFISSVQMHKQRDRVVPYVAIMTFYFWAYMVFKHQILMPDVIKAFLLGNFIAIILAFLSNLWMKISMHMLGIGGLLGLVFCFLQNPFVNISFPLMAVILAVGLVATCRLILRAHTYREIYMGLTFGLLAQLLAFWII